MDRIDNIINLLNYSILYCNAETIVELLPEDLTKLEIAKIILGLYSKAIDETLGEVQKCYEN
jgi:uncharacterized protein YlbG (UPF0298 family)